MQWFLSIRIHKIIKIVPSRSIIKAFFLLTQLMEKLREINSCMGFIDLVRAYTIGCRCTQVLLINKTCTECTKAEIFFLMHIEGKKRASLRCLHQNHT